MHRQRRRGRRMHRAGTQQVLCPWALPRSGVPPNRAAAGSRTTRAITSRRQVRTYGTPSPLSTASPCLSYAAAYPASSRQAFTEDSLVPTRRYRRCCHASTSSLLSKNRADKETSYRLKRMLSVIWLLHPALLFLRPGSTLSLAPLLHLPPLQACSLDVFDGDLCTYSLLCSRTLPPVPPRPPATRADCLPVGCCSMASRHLAAPLCYVPSPPAGSPLSASDWTPSGISLGGLVVLTAGAQLTFALTPSVARPCLPAEAVAFAFAFAPLAAGEDDFAVAPAAPFAALGAAAGSATVTCAGWPLGAYTTAIVLFRAVRYRVRLTYAGAPVAGFPATFVVKPGSRDTSPLSG